MRLMQMAILSSRLAAMLNIFWLPAAVVVVELRAFLGTPVVAAAPAEFFPAQQRWLRRRIQSSSARVVSAAKQVLRTAAMLAAIPRPSVWSRPVVVVAQAAQKTARMVDLAAQAAVVLALERAGRAPLGKVMLVVLALSRSRIRAAAVAGHLSQDNQAEFLSLAQVVMV